jgi:nucleoside-diphosphate-sugar epimerase
MRILLTGASSFTGYWFAQELVAAGHAVTATFRVTEGSYGRAGAQAPR